MEPPLKTLNDGAQRASGCWEGGTAQLLRDRAPLLRALLDLARCNSLCISSLIFPVKQTNKCEVGISLNSVSFKQIIKPEEGVARTPPFTASWSEIQVTTWDLELASEVET